jgi:hypothetical protein
VIAALATLVTVALLALGDAVACTYIRARAVRTGHLTDIAGEIIRGWRR